MNGIKEMLKTKIDESSERELGEVFDLLMNRRTLDVVGNTVVIKRMTYDGVKAIVGNIPLNLGKGWHEVYLEENGPHDIKIVVSNMTSSPKIDLPEGVERDEEEHHGSPFIQDPLDTGIDQAKLYRKELLHILTDYVGTLNASGHGLIAMIGIVSPEGRVEGALKCTEALKHEQRVEIIEKIAKFSKRESLMMGD